MSDDRQTPTRCWPWSHAWSKWTPHREEATNRGVGITLCWQDRTCLKCGKMQQERLPYFVNIKDRTYG